MKKNYNLSTTFNISVRSAIVILVRSLAVLAINKLIASYYGPSGYALYAHFINSIAIFLMVPVEGLGRAVVKYTADANIEHKDRYVAVGFMMNIFLWLVGSIIMVSFSDYFIYTSFSHEPSIHSLVPVVLAIVLAHLITQYYQSVLLGLQKYTMVFIYQVTGAVVSVILVVYTIRNGHLTMTLLGAGLGTGVLFLWAQAGLIKISGWKKMKEALFDLVTHSVFAQYLIAALVAVLCGKFTEYFLRADSLERYGEKLTGIWQAPVRFSDYYNSAYFAFLGMTFYPKVSAMIHSPEALSRFLKKTIIIILPMIMMGLIMVFIFRDYVLEIFFSKEYMRASDYFIYHLPGDLFRMMSFMMVSLLLADSKLKTYIVLQILYVIVLFAGWKFLLNAGYDTGAEYIMASSFASIIYGIVAFVVTFRYLRI